MKRESKKRIMLLNTIVAWMCIVMMLLDTHMISKAISVGANEVSTVVSEEYTMPLAMADGDFTGDKSDKFHKDKTGPVNDGSYRMLFNILEIVPTENKGVLGYTIGGCEPVQLNDIFGESNVNSLINNKTVTEAELRAAVIDAMVNGAPGSDKNYDNGNGTPRDNVFGDDTNYIPQSLDQLNRQLGVGATDPMTFEPATCYGYYKYVGDNKGVYSIAYKPGTTTKDYRGTDNVVMVSRFNATKNNIPSSTGLNDYIWVETASLVSSKGPSDQNIYVQNHRRIRYKNNENFMKIMLDVSVADKDKYIFSVTTKSPLTVTKDNIEDADLILITNNNSGAYQWAAKIYNKAKGVNENTDIGSSFSNTNDLSFDKVLKIYDRVAVREDVAFVAEKNCVNGVTFNTGVTKLMCMLFYVQKKGDVRGSGRRMFQDYLKCYVEDMSAETLDLRTDTRYFDKDSNGNPIGNYSRYMPRSLTLNKSTNLINGYMHDVHPYEQRNDAIMGSYYEYYNDSEGNRRARLKKITLSTIDDLKMDAHSDSDLLGKWYKDGNLVDVTYGEVRNYTGLPKRPPEFRAASVYSHRTDNWFKRLNLPQLTKDEFDNSNILGYYVDDKNEYTSVYPGGLNQDYKYFLNVYASKSNTTDYIYIDEATGDFVRPTGSDNYSGKWYSMNNNADNDGKYYLKTIEWDPINTTVWPWNIDSQQHDQGDKGCLKEWFLCGDEVKHYNDYDQGVDNWATDLHLVFEYYHYDFCNYYRAMKDLDQPSAAYKNQVLVQENEEYKNGNGYVKTALNQRSYKREIEEESRRIENDGIMSLLSVNVTNGDGVNNNSTNKVLYINEYEKTSTTDLPVKFKIRTSANIDSIQLYKKGNTSPLITYKKSATNDVTAAGKPDLTFTSSSPGLRTATITAHNITEGTEKIPGTDDQYVYVIEGTINKAILASDLNDVSTEFEVVAILKKSDSSKSKLTDSDTINVVIRDFFDLN